MLLNKYRIRFEKSLPWRISAFLLDTLGWPVYFLSKKTILTAPKNILIIRKDEIGDVVLSLPIYEAIKKKYPNTKINVLVSSPAAEVLKHNPCINKILILEEFWKKRGLNKLKGLFKTAKLLKKENFDVAIDPKGSLINILLMYLAGIKRRVSYYNISGGKPFLTNAVFYSEQVHEIEANLNLLKIFGIEKKIQIPKLYLVKKEKEEVKNQIKSLALKNFVAIYATPSRKCKLWKAKNFNELIKSFPKTQFLLIATKKDGVIIEDIIQGNKNCKVLYDYNLRKLSYLLSFAKAVVSVDGGPMHLAWISNKNLVALFGQNDIALWKPLNNAKIISHLPNSEQGLNRKPLKLDDENKYMNMIKVDEVKEALKETIK